MNLLTPEQKQKLLDNGSPRNRDKDHPPVVRLFIPDTPCVWLLSELVPNEEPDIAFGLCDLGMGFPELGSVSLSELESVRKGRTFAVERDEHFEAEYPMSVYAEAARNAQEITTDHFALSYAAKSIGKQKIAVQHAPEI